MSLPLLSVLSAAAGAAGASDGPPAYITYLPVAAMMVLAYFLIIRPQAAAQKAHKAKLAALKKGDQVLTGGGLIAKVVGVDGEYCHLEIAQGTKVRALRSTIADVIPPGGAGAAND